LSEDIHRSGEKGGENREYGNTASNVVSQSKNGITGGRGRREKARGREEESRSAPVDKMSTRRKKQRRLECV